MNKRKWIIGGISLGVLSSILLFLSVERTIGFDYQTVSEINRENVRKTLVKYGAKHLTIMKSSDNTPLPYETFEMSGFEFIRVYVWEPDYREGLF